MAQKPEFTSMPNADRRAVITGIGVVAPGGIGNDAWWKAAKAGQSAIGGSRASIRPSTRRSSPARSTASTPSDYLDQRMIVQTDHWTHMALAATQLALDDASFDPEGKDPYRMSVITASGSGGNEFGQKEIENLWGKGPIFVGAYQSIAWFYAATTGQIAIKYGMKGPCGVVCQEGAGGLEALLALAAQHRARRRLRRLRRDGGADRAVRADVPADERAAVAGERAGRRLPPVRRACERLRHGRGRRDRDRRGGGTCEGARRRRRSTREILGYGATNDAFDAKRPAATARSSRARCGWRSSGQASARTTIDAVFADAAGVPEADRAEASAIKEVFGSRRPGDGAEDDDRAAVRAAARRWTWPRRSSRCATASFRRRSTWTRRPTAATSRSSRRRRRGRSAPCS